MIFLSFFSLQYKIPLVVLKTRYTTLWIFSYEKKKIFVAMIYAIPLDVLKTKCTSLNIYSYENKKLIVTIITYKIPLDVTLWILIYENRKHFVAIIYKIPPVVLKTKCTTLNFKWTRNNRCASPYHRLWHLPVSVAVQASLGMSHATSLVGSVGSSLRQ